MKNTGSYEGYASAAVEQFNRLDDKTRYLLVDAVARVEIKRVLDVGCGAGQSLLPFLERTDGLCVGVDAAEQLGVVAKRVYGQSFSSPRVGFARAIGERLPFADESFDLILCRIAIPYMNNRRAIGEFSRVLRPGGVLLLKTHALAFYLGMIVRRLGTLNPKQVAYPVICLAGGLFHWLTGKQLENGFWRGKEVFQTKGFLERECKRLGMRIDHELPDTNVRTPSFFIVKEQ